MKIVGRSATGTRSRTRRHASGNDGSRTRGQPAMTTSPLFAQYVPSRTPLAVSMSCHSSAVKRKALRRWDFAASRSSGFGGSDLGKVGADQRDGASAWDAISSQHFSIRSCGSPAACGQESVIIGVRRVVKI